MKAEALQTAVVESQQTESGESGEASLDISGDVFENFDARLEDLFWFESSEGRLLVADAGTAPEVAVKISLTGGELVAEEADTTEHNFRRMRTISSPTTNANPQFD